MTYKKTAFTLVELLITMTLIAIVSTLGTVYFLGNISETRDGKRISDMETIEKNMDVYFTKRTRFPEPDNPINVTYSGAVAWTQGVFGDNVNTNMGIFGPDYPKDPYYENQYSYSITNQAREFQLSGLLENVADSEGIAELSSVFVPQTQAAGIENAHIVGNYNGFMVRVSGTGTYHFIAAPSIISTDLSNPDILHIIDTQKLVFDGFFNIPQSYEGKIDDLNKGFQFDPSDPLLFSGTETQMKTDAGLNAFSENLKFTYSILPIETFSKYQDMIEAEGNAKLKRLLSRNYKILFKTYLNCLDIKLDGTDFEGDGMYTIDPDGSGILEPYSVYCDMKTDGGGWTRVGDNHVTNGDFTAGSGITSEWGSNSGNTIVPMISPIASGYAIHQYGDPVWSEYQSAMAEYEVHFNDFSKVKLGYEIRMSLWQAEAGNGGFPTVLRHNPEAGYLFHNRIFYAGGTNSINGPMKTLKTQNIGGKLWKQQQVRQKVYKAPQDFHWYIGYDAEAVKDLYFTGVRLELFYR